MTRVLAHREASTGTWVRVDADQIEGCPAVLWRTAPPGGPEPGAREVVLASPAVRTAGTGAPAASITVVLARQPHVDEAIADLVDRAIVAVDLDVAPSADALDVLTASTGVPHHAAVARAARWAVLTDAGAATPAGEGLALHAVLTGTAARRVLDAVAGGASGLLIEVELEHRSAAPPTTIELRFDLADIATQLGARADERRRITADDVRAALAALIDLGIVAVVARDAASVDPDPRALASITLPAFLRGARPVLQPDGDDHFVLSEATTYSMLVTSKVETGTAGAVDRLQLTLPLDDVVASLPAAVEDHVHLVVANAEGGLDPIARRVPATRGTATGSESRMVVVGDRLVSVHRALAADVRRPATSLVAAHTLSPHIGVLLHDDLVVVAPPEEPQPGPVIGDPGAPLWTDRHDPGTHWYAPELSVVVPDPATSVPGSAAFWFRVRPAGHHPDGERGLEATLRLTLERRMSAATTAEWEARGRVDAQPVPLGDLGVQLHLPHRDEGGTTSTQIVSPTSLDDDGTRIIVEFQLADQWARIAYGDLAVAGFQERAAEVSVSYTFGGWHAEPVTAPPIGSLEVVPNLDLVLPVPFRARSIDPPWEDPLVVQVGGLQLRSRRPLAANLALHGVAEIRPDLLAVLEKTEYRWRTNVRQATAAIAFPCGELGHLYVQEVGGQLQALGCQDAFALGDAPSHAFDVVDVAAAAGRAKVLRSLVTPGRYVVVPRDFHIGRFAASDGDRAFRPTVALYTTVDVAEPTNTRCVIAAGLQSDLPVSLLLAITHELRASHHPSPVVQLVTDVPSDVQVVWALPSGGGWAVTAETVRSWDGFQVSLTTDVAGLLAIEQLLVNSGVNGSATFSLSGAEPFSSDVHLDLRAVTGPPGAGPLEVRRSGSSVELVNRIESEVVVQDVLADLDASLTPVPVDRALAPGDTCTVTVPDGATAVAPVYRVTPSATSLQEIRAYVEDIDLEVLVLNLADLAAREVVSVEVRGEIVGLDGDQHGVLTADAPAVRLRFVLPLTTLASRPQLRLRLIATTQAGETRTGEPFEWDLGERGHVISVTGELLP